VRLALAIVVLLVVAASVTLAQSAPTCVVVVDPQAEYGYGGYGGYDGSYYYSSQLSQIAKQELEAALSERGWLVLLNASDVGPTQEELLLENSEWGINGRNRQPIGDFTGATETFLVSAFTFGGRDFELAAWLDDAYPSVRLSDLRVKAIIRRSSTRTREVPAVYEGYGSKRIVKDVRLGIQSSRNFWGGLVQLASQALEAGLTDWQDAGRAAARGAIENALRGIEAPRQLAPTTSSSAFTSADAQTSTPRYIFLMLYGQEVSEGDRFGIWRDNRQIAEVEVEFVRSDNRASCRVLRSSVPDLGRPGDSARSLTPTIPIEQ